MWSSIFSAAFVRDVGGFHREAGIASDAGNSQRPPPPGDGGLGGLSRCAAGKYLIYEDFEAAVAVRLHVLEERRRWSPDGGVPHFPCLRKKWFAS
jgi:hypothetical protein